MAGMPVGVSTFSYIYSRTALDTMLHLGGVGFRSFEMVVFPPHVWPTDLGPGERQEMRNRLRDRDLAIHSLCFPLDDNNLHSMIPEVRRSTIEMYKRVIELGSDLRVPYLLVLSGRVHAFFPPPLASLRSWLAEAVAELAPFAAEAGMRLLLENVPGTMMATSEDVLDMWTRVGDARVGVNLDMCNAYSAGERPEEAFRRLKDHVALVHLADRGPEHHEKQPIGTGIVDYAAVGAALTAAGYDGYSMLEIVTTDRPDEGILRSRERLAAWGWSGEPA